MRLREASSAAQAVSTTARSEARPPVESVSVSLTLALASSPASHRPPVGAEIEHNADVA